MNKNPDLNFFKNLACVASESIMPYFRHKFSVENKEQGGFDPVTIADREAELALRAYISEKRPDDSIHGEEFPNYKGKNDYVWVIDPIDGTRAFISGLPTWGSLVGMTKGGKALAGMMAQPFTKELYYSCGKGSYLYSFDDNQQQQLSVSDCRSLKDAVLFSTAPHLFIDKNLQCFETLSQSVKMTRFGADCYAFAMLASGYVDLVVETGLKPYDIIALIPIIEQAGGIISQWNGDNAEDAGNIIAAATPELYEQAVKILSS